jgi:hypothetical protein
LKFNWTCKCPDNDQINALYPGAERKTISTPMQERSSPSAQQFIMDWAPVRQLLLFVLSLIILCLAKGTQSTHYHAMMPDSGGAA